MINWQNVTVKLSTLKPWEHNPRTMTKAQARRLLKSWNELGQFQTIAIGPGGEVYDGHQRLSALLTAHGAAYEIEARQSDRALTDDERQALTLAANIGAGQWNWDALAAWDVTTLTDWGMDSDTLKTWQSDVSNLGKMLEAEAATGDEDAEPQIDRAAELNEKWQVKTGDLWRIGEHRLLCGDSTKREDVERVMGGDKADLCFTSPPYNQGDKKGGTLNVKTNGKTFYDGGGDNRTPDEYISFCLSVLENVHCILSDGGCIAWNVSYNDNDRQSFIKVVAEFSDILGLREVVTWEKSLAMTIHGANLTRIAELVFIFCNSAPRMNKGKTDCEKNLWKIQNTVDTNDENHGACFPSELPKKGIELFTKHGEIVIEPFAGRGSTIVASQNVDRKCRAIEISPNYCAVILERMITAFPDIVIERIE